MGMRHEEILVPLVIQNQSMQGNRSVQKKPLLVENLIARNYVVVIRVFPRRLECAP